jgi:branched-chain amino acid transport system substrate-binding protein
LQVLSYELKSLVCSSIFMKITLIFSLFLFASSLFAQTEPIKLGVFGDYTGQTSSFGVSTFSGIKMAVEEINAAGGINGRKIEISIQNDDGKPENTLSVVAKLIDEEKVDFLIGSPTSTNSLIAAALAQKAKIPMITPTATNPKVTEIGDYIFRACFVDSVQGEVMAKFAFETLKIKRIALIVDLSSDYSKGLTDSFTTAFKKLGGSIVSRQFYNQNEEDFGQLVQAVKKTKPQAIYISGYYNQVAEIALETKSQKLKTIFLGGDGWDSPNLLDIAKKSLDDSYFTNHFATSDPSDVVQNFVSRYKKLYNLDPDSFAALGYDSVNLLADALVRANSSDKKAVRDALATTQQFVGVTGKISFDSSRNAKKPVYLLKIGNGRFVYNSTVLP